MFGYEAYEVWADFRRLLTRCTRTKRRGRRRAGRAEGDGAASGNDGGKDSQPGS
ncbi:hypothetical protein ACFYRD_37345 [Streptomyces hirsutus]|uniref:hypothetical protein n=1 Tax=Streptomyces hirsutus TaxID=35620 RepID=UPI00369C0C25